MLEQWLRFSNVLFAVFSYWNLIHALVIASPEQLSSNIALGIAGITTGIVLGLLLLLHFSVIQHCILLPVLALSCAATILFVDTSRLLVIPAVGLLSIILTKFIIASSNKINRA